MIFVVIFAMLALAMASLANSSVQLTRNDRSIHRAQGSADSGLEFMKCAISKVLFPTDTDTSVIMSTIYDTWTGSTFASSSITVGKSTTGAPDFNASLTIPATGTLSIGDATFSAVVTFPQDPAFPSDNTKRLLSVGVTGKDTISGLSRSIAMQFKQQPYGGDGTPIYPMFAYGVYSLGGISASGGGRIGVVSGTPSNFASVGSALATVKSLNLASSINIDGKVYVASNVTNQVSYGDITVNGAHRLYGSGEAGWVSANFAVQPPPSPPTFDATVFKSYATSTWVAPANNGTGLNDVQSNVRIPANSGTPSSPLNISGNSHMVLNGIVYIESPNNIVFSGGPNNFNCVFVFANKKNDGTPSTPGVDSLTFTGNNAFNGIPSSGYSSLSTAAAGYAVLAPAVNLNLTASSNTTQFVGSLISNSMVISGSSNFQILNGSVITYSTGGFAKGQTPACQISGSSGFMFKRDSNYVQPTTGMTGGDYTGGGTSGFQYVLNPPTFSEN